MEPNTHPHLVLPEHVPKISDIAEIQSLLDPDQGFSEIIEISAISDSTAHSRDTIHKI